MSFEDMEFIIKNSPKKKSPGPDNFIDELYRTFLETITPILHNIFHKIERPFSNSFYVTSITFTSKSDKDSMWKENHRLISLISTHEKSSTKRSKLNPTYYILKNTSWPMGFLWGMQGWFTIQKSISVFLDTDRLKKNHLIISKDAERSFDEIYCRLMIKSCKL